MSDISATSNARQKRRAILKKFENDLHLKLAATDEGRFAIDDCTSVPYMILKSVYNESSEDLERLCPLALYGAEMNIVSNSIQFGNVLKTARGCADCRDDYDLLLKEQCERPATKLDAQLTNEEQTRHRIEYSKFLAHVDKMLAKKEHEARSEFEEVAENREQGEMYVKHWKQFVVEYINYVVNPMAQEFVYILDVLDSNIMKYLRNIQLCDWMDYKTFWIFLQSFEQLSSVTRDGPLIERSRLDSDYALSAELCNFTPAFLDTLWLHMIEIGWVVNGGLNFASFMKLRHMIYHVNHVHGRRFLFDTLDINKNGRIAAYEFGYFYSSLRKCYLSLYPDREFPEEQAAFISWLEQIKPDCESVEQGVTFEDLKQHKFGADFLFCLISTQGYDKVEYRFEETRSSEQDTEMPQDEINNDLLETLLGSANILNASV